MLPPRPEVLNIPTEKKTLCFQILTAFFFFFLFLAELGYYRELSRVLCAIQWILVDGFINSSLYMLIWTSLVAQMIKNLPAMQETWVRSLGWEDPLEKRMVTASGILAWRIPWTEEPGGP